MQVVHCKREPSTVYIGRGSDMGNPFTHLPLSKTKAYVQVLCVADAVSYCENWARGSITWDHVIPPAVRTKFLAKLKTLRETDVLGCFCRPMHECHGDIIAVLHAEYRAGTFPIP